MCVADGFLSRIGEGTLAKIVCYISRCYNRPQSFSAMALEWVLIMYRLTVLYGHPENPVEFDRYYREAHVPLAKKMQGLKGWTIGKCVSAEPDTEPPYYLIVGLYAESAEAMQAILDSPAGQATIADVPNFATGGVTFLFDEEEVLIPCNLDINDV
jgi:uncharacterized protein (TIGR02118 family)